MLDRSWTSAQLASALCDALVKKGHLKEKPAFIREDREKKIVGYFEGCGLDGAKMETFDNPGPLEMMVRKGTNGEAWVQQVIDALVEMLPESAAKAIKKMGMDDNTKAELEEAKAKTEQRRERLTDEGGEGGGRGGGEGGKGGNRNPPRERQERGSWDDAAGGGNRGRGAGEREERGGWGDSGGGRGGAGGAGRGGGYNNANGGDREERGGWGDSGGGKRGGGKGGGTENMQCYNCDNMGHSSRDCPEPRKDTGKGKGKRHDRKAMVCDNCGQTGHKSRDCNEPVDEEKVRQRLAAKATRESGGGYDD